MRRFEWGIGVRIGARSYLRKPRLKRLKNGPFLEPLIAAISGGPIGWRDWFGHCTAIFSRRGFRLANGLASGPASGPASAQQKARAMAGLMLVYDGAFKSAP